MALPWDEVNYPDETITKLIYDSDERVKENIKNDSVSVYEGAEPLERELKLPQWAPSMKNRNRDFILGHDY